jgi:hypothetical protein
MHSNGEWPSANDREFNYICLALASRLFPDCLFPDPPAGLDWERLEILLRYHRLTAHFYVLGKSQRHNWPPPFHQRLRLDHYGLIIYSDQFIDRVKPVLVELSKTNIQVIVLKGWALIQTVYGGHYGQRIYDDIDILVHPKDADAAGEILKKLGWQAEEQQRPGYARRYYNAQAYYSRPQEIPGRVYSIGFHWGLLHHPAYNPDQIDVGKLFQRAHPLDIGGVPVMSMSIEDHIVYNCAHIVLQHRSEESLLRYYEIAAVIRVANSPLDWQKVEEHAKNWKLILPLKKVIQKVEEIWPGTVPASSMTSIGKIRPALSEQFIQTWYDKTNYNSSLEHLLTWLTMSGMSRRLSFILEDIFLNPTYLKKAYGPASGSFWPLLYVRRFMLVFGNLWQRKK